MKVFTASRIALGCLAAILGFAVSLKGTTLEAVLWADEPYEVYLSQSGSDLGTRFVEGTGGAQGPGTGTVDLVDGITHYIHVVVRNDSDALSSLIGTFHLDGFSFFFPNLIEIPPVSVDTISTDAVYWRARGGDLGSGYAFVDDLGPNGTSPWGSQEGVHADARYIWSDAGAGEQIFTLIVWPVDGTSRRFNVIIQPTYNSYDGSLADTQGVPLAVAYRDGGSKALAISDPGRVGTRTEEFLSLAAGDNYTASQASYDSPDFVLSASGGETTADVSLNLRLKGTIRGGVGQPGLSVQNSTSLSEILAYAQINREPTFLGFAKIEARHEVGTANPGTELTPQSSGFLAGILPADVSGDAGDFVSEYNVVIDQVFTSPMYTVEVGVPFSVRIDITTQSAVTNDQGHAFSAVDFTGGWSWPLTGDVFNLPAGFTINSDSAGIRDNRFEPVAVSEVFTEGIFLKVGDIKGESTAKGYEEWVDVDDFGSRISRSRNLSRRVAPITGDLVVIKNIDASSPKLAEGLTDGTVFDEAVLVANLPESGGSRAAFEYRLKKAIVTEVFVTDETDETVESLPTESVSLNYTRVDWIYRLIGADGSLEGEVVAWWDVETNTGGSSSTTGDNSPPLVEPVGNQPVDPGSEGSIELSVADDETSGDDLVIQVTTDRPDLIGSLTVTGSGATRSVSFITSALRSGFASITATISDGTDTRSISIPILIDVEMTPYEGFLAAYFAEDEIFDPFLSAPLLDPDGDGLATQLEFLLGTNPREFNTGSEAMAMTPDPESDGHAFVVKFRRRLDDPNVKGYFWGSEDMENWTIYDSSNSRYKESVREGENPLYEDVTATITLPPGEVPLFIRYQSVGVF